MSRWFSGGGGVAMEPMHVESPLVADQKTERPDEWGGGMIEKEPCQALTRSVRFCVRGYERSNVSAILGPKEVPIKQWEFSNRNFGVTTTCLFHMTA